MEILGWIAIGVWATLGMCAFCGMVIAAKKFEPKVGDK